MAAKGLGCLGWIFLSIVALTWCVPKDSSVDGGNGSKPQPLIQPQADPRAPAADREMAPPPLPNLQAKPVARRTMYATARVNIRQAPSTAAVILGRLEKGQSVTVNATSSAWHRIEAGNLTGWVNGEYLSSTAAPKSATSRGAPLLQAPLARAFSGRPIREPYTGICDCPYDYKRNGARCGGTSAYSRPGGRDPECYE